jgi:SAM-dependent methyltransferase
MPHYEPKFPFDGYDPSNDYSGMMQVIIDIETYQANALAQWIMGNFKIKSALDIGCGPGNYLVPFKEAGHEVYGVDACPLGGSLLGNEEFKRVDLRFPFSPVHRFDIALCIEVVEHLERHWSEHLVDMLAGCSDLILLTGATPGQGGNQHFNEQPHEFWLDLFKSRHGYVVHPLQSDLRAFLATLIPGPQCQPWLQNNAFLLVKEDA